MQSVATIGSTLTSVQHDVDTIKAALEDQKKKMETLQQNEVRSAVARNGDQNISHRDFQCENRMHTHILSYSLNSAFTICL